MKEDAKGRKHYVSLSDSLEDYSFHNDEIWRIVLHKGKVYFQSFSTLFIYDHKEIKFLYSPPVGKSRIVPDIWCSNVVVLSGSSFL